MAKFQSLLSSITLLFAASVYAGIGPKTDLTISNADVAPDGFTRAAVVVNGVFPGPLITGNQVGDVRAFLLLHVFTDIMVLFLNRVTASSSTSSTR